MFEPWIPTLALILSIIGAVWGLAWWLSGKFTAMSDLIFEQIGKLHKVFIDKLEYHERHDDQRFSNIDNRFSNLRDDLWEIKMRNAAIRSLYLSTEDEELTPVSKKVKQLLKENK